MSQTSEPPTVIVPCYNEEKRLDVRAFEELIESKRVRLLFVDDGSEDATWKVLTRLCENGEMVESIRLPQNLGKAEAVRRGLLSATNASARIVGYYDADLAAPPDELLRLLTIIESDEAIAGVLGARVSMLGVRIERKSTRHYLGRIYGTLASAALAVDVYDTQCGVKLFRVSPTLLGAISQPFRSKWAFDVELLDRLLRGTPQAPGIEVDALREVPLRAWRDVAGSKLSTVAGLRAFSTLVLMLLSQDRPTAKSRERGMRRRRGVRASA